MFAKSKRFQDEHKEYTPGPGEYNIPNGDEFSKHKRYGFLNHTSRFSAENAVDLPADFYASNDSSIASSLSNNSNKTEEARNRRPLGEYATQFEKYRHAMQKEIESLQLKNRKLEGNLQTAVSERDAAQASLLTKDQELAEMRMKNNQLQKSLNRLEKSIDKSPKVIQLQKKVDDMEKELDAAKAAASEAREAAQKEQELHKAAIAEKDELIIQLRSRIEEQSGTISALNSQLEQSHDHLKNVEREHQMIVQSLRTKLDTMANDLTAAHAKINETEAHSMQLNDEISRLRADIQNVQHEKSSLEDRIRTMTAQHQEELQTCHAERVELEKSMQKLEDTLHQSTLDIRSLESQFVEAKAETETLRETIRARDEQIQRKDRVTHRLQTQFDMYRSHVTKLMQQMREKCRLRQSDADRLARELREAKKYINQQALHLDSLKSDLHWLSKWNRQLGNLVEAVLDDGANSSEIMIPFLSATDNINIPLSSSKSVLPNDSGFCAQQDLLKEVLM